MKRMITKLAATVNRMKTAISHSFDAYEDALNELRGTPAYPQMFDSHEII